MKPIDVWGIERADGTIVSYEGEWTFFDDKGRVPSLVGERPVALRIVRRGEAAAEAVADPDTMMQLRVRRLLKVCPRLDEFEIAQILGVDLEAACKVLDQMVAVGQVVRETPAPAPVTRAEFEALLHCTGELALLMQMLAGQCKVEDVHRRAGYIVKESLRIADMRKEPTDGN